MAGAGPPGSPDLLNAFMNDSLLKGLLDDMGMRDGHPSTGGTPSTSGGLAFLGDIPSLPYLASFSSAAPKQLGLDDDGFCDAMSPSRKRSGSGPRLPLSVLGMAWRSAGPKKRTPKQQRAWGKQVPPARRTKRITATCWKPPPSGRRRTRRRISARRSGTGTARSSSPRSSARPSRS
jgi:hypothetical protein